MISTFDKKILRALFFIVTFIYFFLYDFQIPHILANSDSSEVANNNSSSSKESYFKQ